MSFTFEEILAEMSAAPSFPEPSFQEPPPPDPIVDFNNAPQQADDLGQLGQSKPVLKVEQMTICQHGMKCRYLHHQPPERAVCQYCKTPVWDLKECPAGYWWPMHETVTN